MRVGSGAAKCLTRTMTNYAALATHAQTFTDLHIPGDPLVLPNAWDAASAYVIVQAGAAAIATSSASCAWSVGAADGNYMTRANAVAAIARIAAAVDVPVTADIETGYGDGDELAQTIRDVLAAGAVGVNVEDSGGDPLYPIDVATARIATVRAAADEVGVPLYINARVDVIFASDGDETTRVARTIERAGAYIDAGASGIFVPGVRDLATIRELTTNIAAPVNILAGAATPDRAELAQAGVGRISVGSSLNLSILHTLRQTVTNLLATGSFADMGGIPYPELNSYFAARS